MIRPIDLQNTILQSMHNASAVQRAEEGPRLAAQAAQAAFAAEVTVRDESVAAAGEILGNRVDAKADGDRERKPRERRQPHSAFEEVVDEAAGLGDEPTHLVDVTA